MENLTNTTVSTEPTTATNNEALESAKAEYAKLKASFDKVSSELAEQKRKDKERMSDEDKKKAEYAEREEHYKALEKENALYRFKSSLGASIKDEKVLNDIAELYSDGEIDKAIKKQNEYFANYRKEIEREVKAELLKQNPQPTPQSGSTMTREQILAIADPVERQKKIAENIVLFK